MLYPRTTSDGKTVSDSAMVGYWEHLQNKHRMVFVSGVLGPDSIPGDALLALDSLSHDPIKLIISSPGGSLDTTFLFYDTMRLVKSPIYTIGRYCASAAAILLAAGKKRYLMPHAKVMLHLPSGQLMGDARDWDIQHKEMQKYKEEIANILIECGAKKDKCQLLNDMDRDFWLSPEEAIDYGLADKIVTPTLMHKWLAHEVRAGKVKGKEKK